MDATQRVLTKVYALEQIINEMKASPVISTLVKLNEKGQSSSNSLYPIDVKRLGAKVIPDLYPSERAKCSPQWLSLHDALLQLANSTCAAPFRFPVYEMYEPMSLLGYDLKIKKAMDFSRVLEGIVRGKYSSEEDVYADIELIWKNCVQFNGNMHPLVLNNIPSCQKAVNEIRRSRIHLPNHQVDIEILRETVMEKIEHLQNLKPDSLDELIDFLQREVPRAITTDNSGELTLELTDESLSVKQLQAIENFLRPRLDR